MHYNTRRTAHLLKLCMIACLADIDKLVVTLRHFQTALGWLLEMEASIPSVFKAMNSGGDSRIAQDAWYFIYDVWQRTEKPVEKSLLVKFLSERVPAQNIETLINLMLGCESIQPKVYKGKEAYIPKGLEVLK